MKRIQDENTIIYKYCCDALLCVVLLFNYSCKTLSMMSVAQPTTAITHLGSVGEAKSFLLEHDYNSLAIPSYTKGIKLDVQVKLFNKSSFKDFTKAKKMTATKMSVNYIDSLDLKPTYLVLQIADRVAVLNSLNELNNVDVKRYLTNKKEAHLVSTISIMFDENDAQAVLAADEVFLEKDGVKSYALKLYKANTLLQTIQFNQGVVFGYKSSKMCWQEDDKYQLQIVDYVEDGNRCTKGTYKAAKHAKKKINYYKF